MSNNKKRELILFLFINIIGTGCSHPNAIGKYTQPISLQKRYFIDKVLFNNSAADRLSFNEEQIEYQLLKELQPSQNHLSKNATLLKIELLAIKDKDIQKESRLNLHNIFAVIAMFTTRVLPDTSTIEKSEFKQKLFVLKVTLAKDETKLFIEVDNYETIEELKEVFKKELFHKIEELIT